MVRAEDNGIARRTPCLDRYKGAQHGYHVDVALEMSGQPSSVNNAMLEGQGIASPLMRTQLFPTTAVPLSRASSATAAATAGATSRLNTDGMM